ncbi:ribosome biogenesis GTP-binding protein YihA/YsxC [Agriterribacter humi]|uniref:ribosome biogenesis GTP-binding protein YihA/YsxC n=1 Tax=Agriterribacter humi TaxID=1104781 RepID=UPI0012648DD0|nr:ribosome biogenesis GTP-binding protein YihA/YsxC [Agriterribacter humi]
MIITSATYVISSPDYLQCPKADRPEYAFIGRSNVGKSSLINMLCNNQKLAKTSGTPGKTQLINHFAIESASENKQKTQWYIVDLPGYGFAKVSQQQRKSWSKMIEDYLCKRENLVNVFVLVDSRHAPQKPDLEFVNRLGEWEVPFCIVFTKTDKTTQQEVSKNIKYFLNTMRTTWQFLPAHFTSSTIKKSGKDKILAAIEKWNGEFAAGAL